MPVQSCKKDNKPGFSYGPEGFCYTYTPGDESSKERARNRAKKQGSAIEISKHKRNKSEKTSEEGFWTKLGKELGIL